MTAIGEEKKHIFKKVLIYCGLVLAAALLLLGFYMYWELNKIDYVPINQSDGALGITPDSSYESQGPLNLVIFGIDQQDSDIGRSDVIMIVSIDNKNQKIKLSSILRDTYVNIPGRGMDKLNHAYAFGGPQLSISTINSNFDLDIKDFIAVDFSGMEKIVDRVGGVDINVMPEEVSRIKGLTQAGVQHLNGVQAVDYMRIRRVGNGDFQRTERQRSVLTEVIYKLQATGPAEMPGLVDEIFPLISTSFSKKDILDIGADTFAANIQSVEKARFPIDSASHGDMINGIYYLVADLKVNTAVMHDFIYNDIQPDE